MLVGADCCGRGQGRGGRYSSQFTLERVLTQTQPPGTLAARPDKRLRGGMTHAAITNV